jgi:hypothetical protein
MLTTQLTAIASVPTTNGAIDQLDTICSNPDNTPELIKAAFKEVPRKLQARLGEIFLARQALGDFRIGDRVVISEDCSYRSLSGIELVIDHVCSPYIACTRPSDTFAPGLLKTDIKKS